MRMNISPLSLQRQKRSKEWMAKIQYKVKYTSLLKGTKAKA